MIEPWASFHGVRSFVTTSPEPLKHVIRLFLRQEELDETTCRFTLGDQAVGWLYDNQIIERTGDSTVASRYCLISCFDTYLFVQWPQQTSGGKMISSDTYLSGSSFECAREVLKRRPTGRALDIGCGTGLLVMLLASSSTACGIDIDTVAA